jgi:hypothetical protein
MPPLQRGPPRKQSRIEAQSKLYDDPPELKRKVNELAESSFDMMCLHYRELRDILLRYPGNTVNQIVNEMSRESSAARSRSRASAASQQLSPRQEREMTYTLRRTKLNADRVTQESARYREERRIIIRRIKDLNLEIDNITARLGKFVKGSPTKLRESNVVTKRHLYGIERLQKQEELMHLNDRLSEINEIMNGILRKYEDKRTIADISGGTRARKRIINRRTKHCKYGRKNWTITK